MNYYRSAHFFFMIMLLCNSETIVAQDKEPTKDQIVSEVPLEPNNQIKQNKRRRPNRKRTIKFDFTDKPLVDLINELAAEKGINILLPQGALAITTKINYHLKDKLTLDEAWKELNSILDLAGYTIKPRGTMTEIIKIDLPNQGIIRETFPLYIDEPLENLPESEKFIRAIFYLTNLSLKVSGADIAAVLKDMLSLNADIRQDIKTNALILTDKSINIKSAMKIIQELDRSGLRDTIEVLPLYYTSAQLVDDLFNKQLLTPVQQNGIPGQLPQSSYFPRNTKVLALERTNSLVLMGTPHAIEVVRDFIVKYIDRPLESGESILHIYELKYLDAKQLAPVLQQVVSAGMQGQATGKVVGPKQYFKDVIIIAEITSKSEAINPTQPAGDTTGPSVQSADGVQLGGNRLLVAARKKDWLRIIKLIEELDKPQPQIALEILIVDLTLQTNKVFGNQMRNKIGLLDSISPRVNFQSAQLGAPVLTEALTDDITGQSIFSGDALMSNLLQLTQQDPPENLATGLESGSLVISLKDGKGVWSLWQILDKYTNATIVAQPFIVTLNHQQAKVTIQETRLLPMQADPQSAGAVNQQFEPKSAGIVVDILPHISQDNNINLQISVNVNEFINPTTDNNNQITRVVQTSSNVGNGQILALGGLIKTNDLLTITKVPVLGDIPILGWFFKKEQKIKIKNNLIIFINPTIIQPRLRGGIDNYTCKKLAFTEDELDEQLAFENLRDPITRWFFKPDKTFAKRTMDAYTHHALHMKAGEDIAQELAEEISEVGTLDDNFYTAQANQLKDLIKNEENPLLKNNTVTKA